MADKEGECAGMGKITEYSKEELKQLEEELLKTYDQYVKAGLNLDMSRGKPAPTQLDLANGMFDALDSYMTAGGMDARNYGVLDGIPEMKELFAEAFEIPADQIIIGGNASLNLMFDAMMRFMVFGTEGNMPWGRADQVKFLCPAPGYDRHFGITERLGIEMITIPMTEDGPDMDLVEKLAAEDEAIKGIWCVPKFSNPQGICYSDETVKRLASMKTAAPDFRIFWDNAYGIHPIFEDVKVLNILEEAKAAGNPNRPLYFASTSKITFPGAGVSFVAANPEMIEEIKGIMTYQTIGHDKLNQLRHVKFFKNAQGLKDHMQVLADAMRPKFEMVLNMLEEELGGTGLLSWIAPKGGYFVSVDTLEGCAKETVRLVKEAGVVMTGAGATYPYKNDPKDTNIRIAPTYPTVDELKKAMEIFCVCVKLAGVQKLLSE
jgi:aspartate/methionine/tyrosine aminotransferase